MGGILSRWKKKKLSPVESLERLDKDIKGLELSKQTNIEQQKRYATSLIVYSGLIYVVFAVVFYIYYRPIEIHHKFIFSLPLLVFPVIVWIIRKFLHWYFVKRIRKNEVALDELLEEKTKLLDEIMETETYKKAKEILEKFAPERVQPTAVPGSPQQIPAKSGQELRRRTVGGPDSNEQAAAIGGTPYSGSGPRPQSGLDRQAPQPIGAGLSVPVGSPLQQQPMIDGLGRGQQQQQLRSQQGPQNIQLQQQYRRYNPATPPGPPMPRSVLPRERNVMDRLVEYLVGDGPQNRYALICKQCHSHNGMALREEFEYLAFRCCYCYTMNPARKHKPRAPALPKLEAAAESSVTSTSIQSSEEHDNSESRNDGDSSIPPNTGQGQSQVGQGQTQVGQGQSQAGQSQSQAGRGQTGRGQLQAGQDQPEVGQGKKQLGQLKAGQRSPTTCIDGTTKTTCLAYAENTQSDIRRNNSENSNGSNGKSDSSDMEVDGSSDDYDQTTARTLVSRSSIRDDK